MKKAQSKKKRFNPILIPINSSFMNISNTDANSLSFIKRFDQLTNLIASNTLITDLKGVQISESILHIQVDGTPFSKNKYYRIMLLIGLSPLIKTIDKKEVTSYERDLANILQSSTLLLIYQGYLIKNLEPLTLFLNLTDKNSRIKAAESDNSKTIVIPPEKIVIGTKQSLSQIKAQQTFAMIEDLSNEIQKTANDWKIQPIKKNEVGNLLNEIKKVHNINNKKAKKIQKKRNINQQAKVPSNDENDIDNLTVLKTTENNNENKKAVDYQIYSSLVKMLNSAQEEEENNNNNNTIKKDSFINQDEGNQQTELPKSPKRSKSELSRLFRERRKQNSSILENSIISSKDDKSTLEIKTSIDDINIPKDKSIIKASIDQNANDNNNETNKSSIIKSNDKNNEGNKNKIKVIVKKKKKKIIKVQHPQNSKEQTQNEDEESIINDISKPEIIAITETRKENQNANEISKFDEEQILKDSLDSKNEKMTSTNTNRIQTSLQDFDDENNNSKSFEEERLNTIFNKIQKQRNKANKKSMKPKENEISLHQQEINEKIEKLTHEINSTKEQAQIEEEIDEFLNKTQTKESEINEQNSFNKHILTEELSQKVIHSNFETSSKTQMNINENNQENTKENNILNKPTSNSKIKLMIHEMIPIETQNEANKGVFTKEEDNEIKQTFNKNIEDLTHKLIQSKVNNNEIEKQINQLEEQNAENSNKQNELSDKEDENFAKLTQDFERSKSQRNEDLNQLQNESIDEIKYDDDNNNNSALLDENEDINKEKEDIVSQENEDLDKTKENEEDIETTEHNVSKNIEEPTVKDIISEHSENNENSTNSINDKIKDLIQETQTMNEQNDTDNFDDSHACNEINNYIQNQEVNSPNIEDSDQSPNEYIVESIIIENENENNDSTLLKESKEEVLYESNNEKEIKANSEETKQSTNDLAAEIIPNETQRSEIAEQQTDKEIENESKESIPLNTHDAELIENINQISNTNNEDATNEIKYHNRYEEAEVEINQNDEKESLSKSIQESITEIKQNSIISEEKESTNSLLETSNTEPIQIQKGDEQATESKTGKKNHKEKKKAKKTDKNQNQKESNELDLKDSKLNNRLKKLRKIRNQKQAAKENSTTKPTEEQNTNNETIQIDSKPSETNDINDQTSQETPQTPPTINKSTNSLIGSTETPENSTTKPAEDQNTNNKTIQIDSKSSETNDINDQTSQETPQTPSTINKSTKSLIGSTKTPENSTTKPAEDQNTNNETIQIDSKPSETNDINDQTSQETPQIPPTINKSTKSLIGSTETPENSTTSNVSNTLLSGATLLKKDIFNDDKNENNDIVFPSPKTPERYSDSSSTPVVHKTRKNGAIDDEIMRMVWQKPATPIVSIMKRKETPPHAKRSVKFSFSATSDNDLNASNFFSNDDSSDSFDEGNNEDDHKLNASFTINKFENQRIMNENSSEIEGVEDIQYKNKVKQKIALLRKKALQKKNNTSKENQSDSLIDSYLDFDTNKQEKENSKDDYDHQNIKEKLKQIRENSNFFFNDKNEEEDLSENELEYRKWVQQHSMQEQDEKDELDVNVDNQKVEKESEQNEQNLLNMNIADTDEDVTDEETNQLQKKYKSILSTFGSESSSELPPEFNDAYLNFSKDLISISKDDDLKIESSSEAPPQTNKLSEKLSQQLDEREQKEETKNKNLEFESESAQAEMTVGFSPNITDNQVNESDSNKKDEETESHENDTKSSEPALNNENLADLEIINNNISNSMSSESESSSNQRQQVRDKIRAIREKNKKRKQENENKKFQERMKMFSDSFESLAESESKSNSKENTEFTESINNTDNNDSFKDDNINESSNPIDRIRKSAYQRAQRIQNGNSILSSSFGFQNGSSSFISQNTSSPLTNLSTPSNSTSTSPTLSQSSHKSSIGTNRSDASNFTLLSPGNDSGSIASESNQSPEKEKLLKQETAIEIKSGDSQSDNNLHNIQTENETTKMKENESQHDKLTSKTENITNDSELKDNSNSVDTKINNSNSANVSQLNKLTSETERNSNNTQTKNVLDETKNDLNTSKPNKTSPEVKTNQSQTDKFSSEKENNSKPKNLSNAIANKPASKKLSNEKDKSANTSQIRNSSPEKGKNSKISQSKKLLNEKDKSANASLIKKSSPQRAKSTDIAKTNKNSPEKEQIKNNSPPLKRFSTEMQKFYNNISQLELGSPEKGKKSSPEKSNLNKTLQPKDILIGKEKKINASKSDVSLISQSKKVSPEKETKKEEASLNKIKTTNNKNVKTKETTLLNDNNKNNHIRLLSEVRDANKKKTDEKTSSINERNRSVSPATYSMNKINKTKFERSPSLPIKDDENTPQTKNSHKRSLIPRRVNSKPLIKAQNLTAKEGENEKARELKKASSIPLQKQIKNINEIAIKPKGNVNNDKETTLLTNKRIPNININGVNESDSNSDMNDNIPSIDLSKNIFSFNNGVLGSILDDSSSSGEANLSHSPRINSLDPKDDDDDSSVINDSISEAIKEVSSHQLKNEDDEDDETKDSKTQQPTLFTIEEFRNKENTIKQIRNKQTDSNKNTKETDKDTKLSSKEDLVNTLKEENNKQTKNESNLTSNKIGNSLSKSQIIASSNSTDENNKQMKNELNLANDQQIVHKEESKKQVKSESKPVNSQKEQPTKTDESIKKEITESNLPKTQKSNKEDEELNTKVEQVKNESNLSKTQKVASTKNKKERKKKIKKISANQNKKNNEQKEIVHTEEIKDIINENIKENENENETKKENEDVNDDLEKQVYNRSYFFLTEDSVDAFSPTSKNRLKNSPLLNDSKKPQADSQDSNKILNNGIFDSDEENGHFLLRFSLLNEEEEEENELNDQKVKNEQENKVKEESINSKLRKIIRKRRQARREKKANKENQQKEAANAALEKEESTSTKTKVKYQDSLAQILQLKPKVPAIPVPPNNTKTNINHSKSNNDVNNKLIINKNNKNNNEPKKNDTTANNNNKNDDDAKTNVIYPLIDKDKENLIADILHMPSESAQIDEFLELEEIAKLDSNLISSSTEQHNNMLIKRASSLLPPNHFSSPELNSHTKSSNDKNKVEDDQTQYSPIHPLKYDDSELIDQFPVIPSESETSSEAFNSKERRQQRQRRKSGNNDNKVNLQKREREFDEDEEMLTYLSENEDDSGDDNFLLKKRNEHELNQNANNQNGNKNNMQNNNPPKYQYRYESDSDSISDVFRTSPKNPNH